MRAGNPRAGTAFREEFSQFKTFMAGAAAQEFQHSEFDDPESDAAKARAELLELDPFGEEFRDIDPVSGDFVVDWDAWDDRTNELIDIIEEGATGYRAAYEKRLRLPEELADVETAFLKVKKWRDELGDISPVVGLPPHEYDLIREFLGDVERQRDAWLDQGSDIPLKRSVTHLGDAWHMDANLVGWALVLRGNIPDKLRNSRYDQFLIEHRGGHSLEDAGLELFFESLYTRRVRKVDAGLPTGSTTTGTTAASGSGGGRGAGRQRAGAGVR